MGAATEQLTTAVVRIPTADGGSVAIKRRGNPGGRPVLFLHGLAVNADLWNLPEVRGPDFHYRSLASILYAAGYDVWLINLRGHGGPHMRSEPPPDQTDWCVDHFIMFDLPAVVDYVLATTRRPPVLIGASMGAMTLAGYLQGARYTGCRCAKPGHTGTAVDVDEGRIVADAALARERQRRLAGAVFAEFPAALRWPESLYDAGGRLKWRALLRDWWRNDGDLNYPFELLARWGWLHALLSAVGQVRLNALAADLERGPWYRRWRLPLPLATNIERLERRVIQTLLNVAGTFTGATHHRAEVMLAGHRYILDHMKAGVLRQLAKCVRRGAFVSLLGEPEHAYSDHYGLVELPILVVQGGRDRIANAEVTRTAFFERVASTGKKWLFYPEIAHGELEAAPIATERVYPAIQSWLAGCAAPHG